MSIKDLLDYLDGRGIVFEDEDLVKEALEEINVSYEDEDTVRKSESIYKEFKF